MGNRRMEGNDLMFAVGLARATDITDDDHKPPPFDQCSTARLPDAVELLEEDLIVVVSPKLSFVVRVLLEVEVGRRGHDKVHRLLLDVNHLAGVTQEESMMGGNLLERSAHGTERTTVLREPRDFLLRERLESNGGEMPFNQAL